MDLEISQRRGWDIGGHFSEERKGGRGKRGGNVRSALVYLQQAIKEKLAMSPAESWPCCSLALSSPCVLCSPRCLLSDCHKASARPLCETNPHSTTTSPFSLSCCLSTWLRWTVDRRFSASCSSEPCWFDQHHAKKPVGGRRRVL